MSGLFEVEYFDAKRSLDISVAYLHHGDASRSPRWVQTVVDLLVLPHLCVGAVFVHAGDDQERVGRAEEALLVGQLAGGEAHA